MLNRVEKYAVSSLSFQFFTLDSESRGEEGGVWVEVEAFNSLHWILHHSTSWSGRFNARCIFQFFTLDSENESRGKGKGDQCFQFFTLDSKLDL